MILLQAFRDGLVKRAFMIEDLTNADLETVAYANSVVELGTGRLLQEGILSIEGQTQIRGETKRKCVCRGYEFCKDYKHCFSRGNYFFQLLNFQRA